MLALYLFIVKVHTKPYWKIRLYFSVGGQDILSACVGAQAGLNMAMPGYDKKNPLSDCLITDFFEIFLSNCHAIIRHCLIFKPPVTTGHRHRYIKAPAVEIMSTIFVIVFIRAHLLAIQK